MMAFSVGKRADRINYKEMIENGMVELSKNVPFHKLDDADLTRDWENAAKPTDTILLLKTLACREFWRRS